jgi:hypothetical protein
MRLLDLQVNNWLVVPIDIQPDQWILEMLEGLVTSADTGAEELIRASRAALVDFVEKGHIDLVCSSLLSVARRNLDNDRVLVPALEVMGFMFDTGIMQQSSTK